MFPPIKQAVKAQIQEAQKIASGGGSEQDVAESKIELEVSSGSWVRLCMVTCGSVTSDPPLHIVKALLVLLMLRGN